MLVYTRNEIDEARLIRCHCLAHARRKFSDIEEDFPEACDVVIRALKDVFDHEEAAKKAHMSDAERLAHHQTYSEPILERLETWMEKQFQEREVEPNSSLGKAFTYMLSHWQTLTQFLRVPKAPVGYSKNFAFANVTRMKYTESTSIYAEKGRYDSVTCGSGDWICQGFNG